MMGPGETIAAMVLGGAVIGLMILIGNMFPHYMAYKKRALDATADATAEKAAQYASRVEKLEQRMRVLERIATDKGVTLAAEIEDLRGETRVLVGSGEAN